MLEIDESLRETEPDCISGSKQHDLMLRTPAQHDLGMIVSLAGNPGLVKNLCHSPLPVTVDEAKIWLNDLKANDQRTLDCFMLSSMTGETYGVAWLEQTDETRAERELGIILRQSCWGQNIATRAVQAMVDFAFSNPTTHDKSIRYLSARCRVSCPKSRRLMEKCGFQYAGTGMARSSHYRGMIPIDRFKLDRGIWTALRHWSLAGSTPTAPETHPRDTVEDDLLKGAA